MVMAGPSSVSFPALLKWSKVSASPSLTPCLIIFGPEARPSLRFSAFHFPLSFFVSTQVLFSFLATYGSRPVFNELHSI